MPAPSPLSFLASRQLYMVTIDRIVYLSRATLKSCSPNGRLKDVDGPISPLLYILYFLPTSINTAWISVASGIGIAIVGNVESTPFPKLGAVLLAAAVSALSKLPHS